MSAIEQKLKFNVFCEAKKCEKALTNLLEKKKCHFHLFFYYEDGLTVMTTGKEKSYLLDLQFPRNIFVMSLIITNVRNPSNLFAMFLIITDWTSSFPIDQHYEL